MGKSFKDKFITHCKPWLRKSSLKGVTHIGVDEKVFNTYGKTIYDRVKTLPHNMRWGMEHQARFIQDWEQITKKLNRSGIDLSRILITRKYDDD